jgi:hypothetical protein
MFAADIGEGGEALDDGLVGFALCGDEPHGPGGYVRNLQREFADGVFPLLNVRLAIFEEEPEGIDQPFGAGNVVVERD